MRQIGSWILFSMLGCSTPPAPAPGPVVVLASFDTTRVDSVSAYGGADASTPHLDALAARGVRFNWALSSLPTTLGSLTTMMSGLDTHGHGVPRNGQPVPEDVPLLAERLRDAGWDRIAVVGAMPLESDMGLDRGFRVYKDTEFSSWFGSPRKGADEVTDAALKAIDERPGGQPLFLFVHYYDPHSPWEAAPQAIRDQFVDPDFELDRGGIDGLEVFRTRARKGMKLKQSRVRNARKLYLAQVHWTDQEFGRLLSGLDARGLMDDALVIMTADHGEMLNERRLGQIYTHGPDVDLPVIHVPMIVAGTGQFEVPSGRVVDRRVRLSDIPNTILSAASLPATLGNGEDLAAVWSGTAGPPPAHFAEATRSGLNMRLGKSPEGVWPNLQFERTVIDEDAMLVYTPWTGDAPTLHAVDVTQSVIRDDEKAGRLRSALDAWDAAAPSEGAGEMDAATEEALRQLGYLE
ncbi:MAG: sulfatase [Myxococcota bacterium]|nr:sulfatase [Myxococcota bacterium]